MKETPILMCAEMVRAILRTQNPKTQTRRVIHPQFNGAPSQSNARPHEWSWFEAHSTHCHGVINCPYGTQGDRLWVKETFGIIPDDGGTYVYRATDPEWQTEGGLKWKPSIFMRREASRILLEVTQVRVQRVQNISDADALAEGVELRGTTRWHGEAVAAYRTLWNSLNLDPRPIMARGESGKREIVGYEAFPWSEDDFMAKYPANTWAEWPGRVGYFRDKPLTVHANPWVWAVTFRQIQP